MGAEVPPVHISAKCKTTTRSFSKNDVAGRESTNEEIRQQKGAEIARQTCSLGLLRTPYLRWETPSFRKKFSVVGYLIWDRTTSPLYRASENSGIDFNPEAFFSCVHAIPL